MDFLIFSDSHGRGDGMQMALLRQIKPPLGIFYLGDGYRDAMALETNGIPVYSVKGNCDFFGGDWNGEFPEERLVTVGSHLALVTHGAKYGVKSGLGGLSAAAVRAEADLALYGHTHVPKLDVIPEGTEICGRVLNRPLYLFNPGSIGMGGSFGTLHIEGKTVLFGHGKC